MNNAYVNSICAVTINSLMLVGASCCLGSFAEISLDVDADRDGIVEKNNPNKVSFVCLLSCDHHYWGNLFLAYCYSFGDGGTQKEIFRKMYFLSVQSKSIRSGSPCPPVNEQLWLLLNLFVCQLCLTVHIFFRIERYKLIIPRRNIRTVRYKLGIVNTKINIFCSVAVTKNRFVRCKLRIAKYNS